MATAEMNVAQLRWRCRRGMRELDGVLSGFLERRFADLGDTQKAAFVTVLQMSDPDIYAYLACRMTPKERAIAEIFAEIRASIRPAH